MGNALRFFASPFVTIADNKIETFATRTFPFRAKGKYGYGKGSEGELRLVPLSKCDNRETARYCFTWTNNPGLARPRIE